MTALDDVLRLSALDYDKKSLRLVTKKKEEEREHGLGVMMSNSCSLRVLRPRGCCCL